MSSESINNELRTTSYNEKNYAIQPNADTDD
jgi:hypothetical protein